MTVTEFKQREFADDTIIRVNVKDHKTVDTYGSAPLLLYQSEPLMLHQSEFEWISMFINNVRSKISSVTPICFHFMEWRQDDL